MTPAIPSNYANAVAPFTPLGRAPVGLAADDLRGSSLQPLEESAESARGDNQRSPDRRPGEVDEAAWLSQQRARRRGGQGETGAPAGRPAEENVTLSRSGREAFASEAPVPVEDAELPPTVPSEERSPRESGSGEARADSDVRNQLQRQRELETRQEIGELAARDREVRLHEQAHAALGGRYAGAPQYEFKRGPDGVSYAVSGEVPIDTSKVPNDPEATLEKAQQIRRAAFAPAELSDTDRQVAAQAARMEAEARAELRQRELETTGDASGEAAGSGEIGARAPAAQNDGDRSREARGEEDMAGKEARAEEREALADEMRRRNIDTYLQLVELTAPSGPGGRLDQRV